MATNTTAGSTTNRQRIQQHLRAFNFKALFVEELGWDILGEHPLIIPIEGVPYVLRPLVEKRGVRVFVCEPDVVGRIPTDRVLRKIEHEVIRYAYEHFIIYVDAARENQIWLWVKREQGKRLASRMHRYHKGQSGELLSQKLERLAIGLEEEERLQMTEVAGRVAKAFDVERVTKKFYDRFKHELAAFLNLIGGIEAQTDREWYASLMLNRLMFIYFIQRKGFLDTQAPGRLDGDPNYLSNRLRRVQHERGEDQFHTFYRYFLLKLFHEGLSQRVHAPELEGLLGRVPYLNGGLFDVHVLERAYPEIAIPDEAFEQLFAFLDEFDWYLDDRPLKNDKEINPDVLGYIFEKYINQKQMGAYYTKEDITDYISKNTILPYLFDAAHQKCLIDFDADGPIWSLLRKNPERYIYAAVKHGCELPLPPEIAAGIDDVSQRTQWNKPAPEAYALPTEIWREVVARRTRYTELRMKLANGEVTSINDLITYNLDMRKFAEEVIHACDDASLLRAFYESIEQVTVLDPTCGSGAFLFAALAILEPLYTACLEQMQLMVQERDMLDAPLRPEQRRSYTNIDRFSEILLQMAKHPSRSYFVLKSIIIRNLYGVDIMEEATEICKLRLFLKLVSQINKFSDIEPLPDIDFNIRAGNTLVGFVSQAEVNKAVTQDLRTAMTSADTLQRIEQQAREVERGFADFRKLQTQLDLDPRILAESKQTLRTKLALLSNELDIYLAAEYGIDQNRFPKKEEYEEKFAQWRHSHQPFHWFVEFYGIMKDSGFGVIIGNPPYVEYSKIRKDYQLHSYRTENCGNLYAFSMERSFSFMRERGRFGMIVQLSSVCTDRMLELQNELRATASRIWISNYDDRPAKLFDGLEHIRASIIITQVSGNEREQPEIYSTNLIRWYSECRPVLFTLVAYNTVVGLDIPGSIPKIGDGQLKCLISKVRYKDQYVGDVYNQHSPNQVYYYRS